MQNNSTSGMTTTQTTTTGAGSNTATLTILAAPTITEAFSQATIQFGGISAVTLTLTNGNSSALTGGAFTDTLVSMSTAGGAVGGTCDGTTPSTLPTGQTALNFGGITIPASSSCTVTVRVTSIATGPLNNTTSGVTTTQTTLAGPPSNTATLMVLGCNPTLDSPPSVQDVQFILNEALGIGTPVYDLNGDGVVNVVDVQMVVNAALGLGCSL
jgi:mucin-19